MNAPKFNLREAVADDVATRSGLDLERLAEPPALLEGPRAAAPKGRAKKAPAGPRGSARPGARGVTVWLEPETWLTLKMIGLKTGKTTQDIVDGLIERECAKHRTGAGA